MNSNGFDFVINNDNTCRICGYTGTNNNVVIPEILDGHKVTVISGDMFSGAFRDNTNITSVVIPNGVYSINERTFEGCSSLVSVSLPDSIREIADGAFADCTSLTNINIPANLSSIGNSIFYNCKALTNPSIPANLQVSLDVLLKGSGNNTNKLWVEDNRCYWVGDKSTCHEVAIPDGVTCIAENAFDKCTNLTSIQIPESVVEIGSCAFGGCSSLSSIRIPSGVKVIKMSTFAFCSQLTDVVLPDGEITIEYNAFLDCSSLANINISGSTIIESAAFEDCNSLPGRLVVNGNKCSWMGNKDQCREVVIPDGVTCIETEAFTYCNNLSSITLPEGLEKIEERAFDGCTNLTSVHLPASLRYLGPGAFSNCSSLTSINADLVPEIYNDTFSQCDKLVNPPTPTCDSQL